MHAKFHNQLMECFGGPLDGQKIPVPKTLPDGSPAANGFVVSIGDDGPHIYIIITRVNTDTLDAFEVLEYAGRDPHQAAMILKKINPNAARKMFKDLDNLFFGDDDDEYSTG